MEQENEQKHCHHRMKYVLIFLGALIGAFLAFYFIADVTIKTLLSPEYQIRHAQRMMNQMERKLDKDIKKQIMENPVQIIEEKDAYKIIVNLKFFDNNAGNVMFNIDDNMLTVAGKIDKRQGNHDNMMSFSQTYLIDKKVDEDNVVKKENRGSYIITVPIEK